jgi:hypothetical protein
MAAAVAITMTPEMMYEMRSTITKLELTEAMKAIIADMQLIPVAPVYNRRPAAAPRMRRSGGGGSASAAASEETWRRSAIVAIRRAPRVKDDADYEKITGLVNKVVASTVEEKAKVIHEIVKTRADDPTFRIRILNFIFDRGVSMPFFAQVLADLISALCKRLPEMADDLAEYCSVETFEAMFQEATITFPKKDDPLPEGALAKVYKNLPMEHDERKGHWANFLHCAKNKLEPISDVHSHMKMLNICHLAGIAARLGRSLEWNDAAERIVGDDQADGMLSRPVRKGFEIEGV